MGRSFSINPTYYTTVERALYNAGELDLGVEFSKADTSRGVPFITEVTVKDGRDDNYAQRVEQALKPFLG